MENMNKLELTSKDGGEEDLTRYFVSINGIQVNETYVLAHAIKVFDEFRKTLHNTICEVEQGLL